MFSIFISGCTLTMGIIAAYYDEPTTLVVTIESDPPGAEVYLNKKKIGIAPIKVTIEGLSKEHKVVLIKNGYKTKIETVSISPGRQLDENHLSVVRPDGTSVQVENQILSVALQKEEYAP
jgi:hypothetical protein